MCFDAQEYIKIIFKIAQKMQYIKISKNWPSSFEMEVENVKS